MKIQISFEYRKIITVFTKNTDQFLVQKKISDLKDHISFWFRKKSDLKDRISFLVLKKKKKIRYERSNQFLVLKKKKNQI